MWRDKDNLFSNPEPAKCVCGAVARIRYRIPVTWVECKRKCGIKTGYYIDKTEQCDPDARDEAVKCWNAMIAHIRDD
jgi:hypothetical protein